ncbi:hypothetical protein SISSUDRAFT_432532 [Sistotremastrum suecicum HHB10207 ss-3]|uniref:Uncharacterized protein n=1 Tax=Sistotremastrum suecicum HHB10207 ss-3 TaxID=1314776 RepID=A0A165YGJ7_9AGAM|nr:hypothetical protein SISSUDRAFT_432532 [Sistotremastrum suecicum HHB10207 ss-3]
MNIGEEQLGVGVFTPRNLGRRHRGGLCDGSDFSGRLAQDHPYFSLRVGDHYRWKRCLPEVDAYGVEPPYPWLFRLDTSWSDHESQTSVVSDLSLRIASHDTCCAAERRRVLSFCPFDSRKETGCVGK